MAKKGNGGQGKDPGKKLRKLIKGARVVMLTTVGSDGRFRSRPMMPGAFEDGALWFLTRVPSAKTQDITDNQRVNLAYSAPKEDRYVSIAGTATVVRDPGQVRELWGREHKAWFPNGKNDPDLAVLRVQVDQVEYWDAEQGRMVPMAAGGSRADDMGGAPDQPVSPGALG